MRLEGGGLNIFEYGRFRKFGEVNSFKCVNGNDYLAIGDCIYLFDMMIFLCDRSNVHPEKYLFKHAMKIIDYDIQKMQDAGDW